MNNDPRLMRMHILNNIERDYNVQIWSGRLGLDQIHYYVRKYQGPRQPWGQTYTFHISKSDDLDKTLRFELNKLYD